jgi:DMSO/TMAO reductase YedYZ molybdopterin-dependent catalytic subunit
MVSDSPPWCHGAVSERRTSDRPTRPPQPPVPGTPIGRRVILGMLGLGAIGVLTGKTLQSGINAVVARDPTGLTSLLPGANGFRYYSITGSEPVETTEQYRLTIKGLVDKPVTLTYAELEAMPQTVLVKDFQCVTGWRVPSVHWSGVSLSHLLDVVGVQDSAQAVLFGSFDGAYSESLTLDQATGTDTIVATRMLGAPVTKSHGGPVRLYVAPMYGYKSIKWLNSIVLAPQVVPGFWEQNGYDVDAWIGKSNGRSDAPVN